MSGLRLDDLDRDGALREAASGSPSPRRAFLRARGPAPRASCSPAWRRRPARPPRRADSDVSILNYALTLEYLQADFYTEAERQGALAASRRARPARSGRWSGHTSRPCARRSGIRPSPARPSTSRAPPPPATRSCARRRLRGPRHGRLQGPAGGDPRARVRRRGGLDPHRRGAPRRLDPLPGGRRPAAEAVDEPISAPRPSGSSPRPGSSSRRRRPRPTATPRSRGEAGGSRRMLRRAALLVAVCWCALAAGCLGVLVAAVASISSSPEPSLLPPTGDIAEPRSRPSRCRLARPGRRRRPPAGPP